MIFKSSVSFCIELGLNFQSLKHRKMHLLHVRVANPLKTVEFDYEIGLSLIWVHIFSVRYIEMWSGC